MRTVVMLLVGGCAAPGIAPPMDGRGLAARLIGPPRQTLTGAPNTAFGAVSAAGDFDGDGHGDVVIGSPDTPDGGLFDVGALEVHRGGPGGLDPIAAITLWGDRESDRLGSELAVGDFDGDGFDDLAASDDGDWDDPFPDRVIDRIPVWLGGPTGLAAEPDLVLEDDTFSYFGYALSSAGDLDGDGRDDLLVGDISGPSGSGFRGRVLVYHGSAAGLDAAPALVLLGERESDSMGRSLVIVGDVDGDGYDDAAITVPEADDGGADAGKVQIHHGGFGGLEPDPRTEILGATALDQVTDVTAAGDMNGDGYADLLLGKAYAGGGYQGRVDLHLGGFTGLDPIPAVVLYGADFGGLELSLTHGIGDFDEDGYDDVVFKFDPVAQDAAGALILGTPGLGIDLAPGFEVFDVPNIGGDSNFAQEVSSIDVDGDGHLDLFVTDPYSNAAGALAGAGYLFAGNEDLDGDGHGSLSDCDESDPSVHPEAPEECDGVDQDCDGAVDEDAPGLPFEADRDGDGFTDRADAVEACTDPPAGYVPPSVRADCDDQDAARNPEAVEVPGDGIDQDCDGVDAAGPDPIDTGGEPAAGSDEPGDGKESGGCGCATGGPGGAAGLAALGLALGRRRRRLC